MDRIAHQSLSSALAMRAALPAGLPVVSGTLYYRHRVVHAKVEDACQVCLDSEASDYLVISVAFCRAAACHLEICPHKMTLHLVAGQVLRSPSLVQKLLVAGLKAELGCVLMVGRYC